jgi:hypothetical protein
VFSTDTVRVRFRFTQPTSDKMLSTILGGRTSSATSSEQTALDLGAYARKVLDDYKNAEIDAFALRLAAEKQAKKESAAPNAAGRAGGSGRGGRNSGLVVVNRKDLMIRPISTTIPTKIPRVPKLYTFSVMVPMAIATSATVITEVGYSVSLNSHPQVGSLTSLFDRWGVDTLTATFRSRIPPGSTTAPCRFVTSIDLDNTTALGSFAAYGQYDNAREIVMSTGTTLVRSCRPCCKPSVNGTTNAAMGRFWCDSATSNTPWFGIRACADIAGAIYAIDVELFIVFVFSNVI